MIARCGSWAVAVGLLGCLLSVAIAIGAAGAQINPSLVNPDGIPPQIIPTFGEVGITWNGASGAGSGATGGGAGGGTSAPGAAMDASVYQPGGSGALNAMLATDYGATAVNVEFVAAFGQAESGFRNMPTANGSSTATGPWQFTAPTFLAVANQYGLGYTAADVTNPQA